MRLRQGCLGMLMLLAAGCASNPSTFGSSATADSHANDIERCTGEIVFRKISDVPTTANPTGILLHGVLDCANQGPRKIDATLDQATTWDVVSPCRIDLAFKPDLGGKVRIACSGGQIANGLMRMFRPGRNGVLQAKTDAGDVIAFAYMLNEP